MDLEQLRDGIRSMATMEEPDAPISSCYVNVEARTESYRPALDERVRLLRHLPPEKRAMELSRMSRDGVES